MEWAVFMIVSAHTLEDSGIVNDVFKGFNVALTHGLVPNISITVSSRTAEGLPDVIGGYWNGIFHLT